MIKLCHVMLTQGYNMVQLAVLRTDPLLAFAHLKDSCLCVAYYGMSFSCESDHSYHYCLLLAVA